MFTINDYYAFIEQQLRHNENKNIFYSKTALTPSTQSVNFLKNHLHDLTQFIYRVQQSETYEKLLHNTAKKTIHIFTEMNQFLDFHLAHFDDLKVIYHDFFTKILSLEKKEFIEDYDIQQVFLSHYENLKSFLIHSNGEEIFKKYEESPSLPFIECAQYSPEFQLQLLNIDVQTLQEPVLDIGCGYQGALVEYLRQYGIDAIGIERDVKKADYLYQSNWFEFEYSPNSWGTIISHMAFSNHFIHHHLRKDGNYQEYATLYMKLLESLKPGGRFIYAPSLPFIEDLLDSAPTKYIVIRGEKETHIVKAES